MNFHPLLLFMALTFLWGVYNYWGHYLNLLLSLEILVLWILLTLGMNLSPLLSKGEDFIYFLVMAVVGSSFGLCLMILMGGQKGANLFSSGFSL